MRLAAFAACLLPFWVWPAAAAVVTVHVGGVRNDKGHVLAALCSRQEFLAPHCSYIGNAAARPGSVTISINGVPPGTYAIQVFHDENDNKRIDRNLLGLPTEGIGFSNGASFHFGPPSFDSAAVTIEAQGGAFAIKLRYF